ncbi:MAG: hypothetical protein FJ125_13295 [Deltaproteobacteria bacterium]|nr:hypothetical protein [Deltaproteobacteria bacterium]
MRAFFREEKGNALVITVLVCLAMTGLALVAVTTTNVQNQLANNQKMVKQAHYIAETGLMITMQRIQNIGSSSILKERERLLREDPQKKISFSLESFGKNAVFLTQSNDPQLNTLGPDRSEIDFTVELDSIRTAPPPAGYQINLDQPPQSLEVSLLASGKIGRLVLDPQEDGQNTMDVGYSERRVWALVPVP